MLLQTIIPVERTREHDILGKVRGTKDQPTDRGIYALTRDVWALTHEKCHGSSRPDPHETRISRVTRIVAGRVGSGQENFKISRVGSGRVGRFSKSRGSGRVGSRRLKILAGRIGSGQDGSKFSRVGSGQMIRPDPIRPDPRDLTRPVKRPGKLQPLCDQLHHNFEC